VLFLHLLPKEASPTALLLFPSDLPVPAAERSPRCNPHRQTAGPSDSQRPDYKNAERPAHSGNCPEAQCGRLLLRQRFFPPLRPAFSVCLLPLLVSDTSHTGIKTDPVLPAGNGRYSVLHRRPQTDGCVPPGRRP